MGWSGMVAALPCLLRASTIQFHSIPFSDFSAFMIFAGRVAG